MTGSKNDKESTQKRATLPLLAAVSLLLPLYSTIVWFTSWKNGASQSENVAAYISYFPGLLRDTTVLTWLSLIFSVIANILSISASLSKKTKARWVAIPLLLIGIPVMLWWGFTLL